MTEERWERIHRIYVELCTRLASNNWSTTIKMRRTGREYNISTLASNKLYVCTDRDTNEIGETIWKTVVGTFKDDWAVAKFIDEQARA